MGYQKLTIDKLHNPAAVEDALMYISQESRFKDLYINLEPFTNQSAINLPEKFSLHRTYIIFRTLGMRHLTVTNEENRVVGIITRKDLMGFNMEEKLSDLINLPTDGDTSPGAHDVELLDGGDYRGIPT